MDLRTLKSAVFQIAQEKGISEKKVIETIEEALAAAYKRAYGKKPQKIKAKFDPDSGEVQLWQVKRVVTGEMIYSEKELEELEKKKESSLAKSAEDKEGKIVFNPERHIMLDEARKTDAKIEPEQELKIPLEVRGDYGRIATQTAKQVILQKIREAERETLFEHYKEKEEGIISGIVQRAEERNVFFDIGKVLGVLPKEEQVPGEFYKLGQRFKLYVLRVEKSPKGPIVFLSRAFPKIISRLFELEVPEIAAGQVQIKSIAREPGSRTKIAVQSTEEDLDPIGATVGQRGSRVLSVISELGGEKIDIIEYSEKPEEYIANALSPAKILEVEILPKNKALCLVSDDQLSLAIGRDGQNVRLAAKLTGWKIDVRGNKEQEIGSEKQEMQKEKEKNNENRNKKD